MDLFWKSPNNLQRGEAKKIKKKVRNELARNRRHSSLTPRDAFKGDLGKVRFYLRIVHLSLSTLPQRDFMISLISSLLFDCCCTFSPILFRLPFLSSFSFHPGERNICSRLSFCVVYLFLCCTHMSQIFSSSFNLLHVSF